MKHKDYITASLLYDYIKCPHRVWRDIYGPQNEKIKEINPFIEMLWQKGVQHEKWIMKNQEEYLDLAEGTLELRFERTLEAMKRGVSLIYQGVIRADGLLGAPDLLRKKPNGEYMPIDIKSGMGVEGADEDEENGKPKKHYAVQICLYVDVLKRLGFASDNRGMIIDIKGNEVVYELDQPMGKLMPTSWWHFYEQVKEEVKRLVANRAKNKPALAGSCKLCPWYTSCKGWVNENNDLTKIFYLGRSKRDIINEQINIERVEDILNIDVGLINQMKKKDKNFLKGVGESTLTKIIQRAHVLEFLKEPIVYKQIIFPDVSTEIFFDIEDDPTQEFVYLHGQYERNLVTNTEKYVPFVAKEVSDEGEKEAFREFWQYAKSFDLEDTAFYYYSAHEKTTYKKMARMYPDVATEDEVINFFEHPNVIDLYTEIVYKFTDWPLSSYSIKELAVFLGFKWRDETPSGALSIQWYNEYLKTNDEKILKRILEYNEDDCIATLVVKDGIEKLKFSHKPEILSK